MKNVCFVVQSHYDSDIRVRRKAEALVAAGYGVDVLALRARNTQKAYILEGVNVRTLSLGKQRGSLARYAFEYLAFLLWALWRLTVQMASRRYAMIDVNTLPDFLVFAAATAKWMGAKVVLDMHEITPEFYMSKYGIGEKSRFVGLMKFLERISFNFADHVLTINDPIEDLLVSRGLNRANSTVITNAADDSKFAGGARPCVEADAAAASADFVMVYHGTLTRLYGLDIAIEAFALAHDKMPGAELWILGGGPEAPSLAALARQHELTSKVRLFGVVPHSTIPAWLSKCHVGVLPIRRDVFLEFASPNKLAEFIVTGKPVLISSLKAIRHYFSDAALAYFEPNDPADLARQMVRVYADADLRRRLSDNAREEYAPISWPVMKRRYLELIGTLIGPAIAQTEQTNMVSVA